MTRTILVHLNVELPDDSTATTDDVVHEVEGALEVGTDPDEAPALSSATVVVAMAEEI